MMTVNMWHIADLLGPLTSVGPVREWERIAAIADADKPALRSVFAEHLVPVYARLRPHGQTSVWQSLRYFLNARPAGMVDMMAALQDMPLAGMDDPYQMLEALWEVLYPTEDWRLDDLSMFVERNDDAKGNEIFAPDGGWGS